jgi:hypothetical protein
LRAGGAHGTACQGLADVTEALRFGQVDTPIVTDPVTVRVGDDRTQVMTDGADGSANGTVERADEAVPVAAIATSADVRVLTGGEAEPFADGVAALLRFSR